MGGYFSSPSPFSEPWRNIKWGNNKADLEFVKSYKPEFKGQTLRILLHGPEGAGKSSFINSVHSVLKGRIYSQALADNHSHTSFTKQYTTYKIHKDGGSLYPFVFCDIMGLSQKGALEKDVKLALRGHVKEGYKFQHTSQLNMAHKFYEHTPSSKDKVHVLVCVFPADKLDIMSDEVVKKIRRIRSDASSLHISQIAVLTRIDHLCPEMKEDVKNVYKLQKMKETMEKFSCLVGIPMNCIFPVKNYHEEINMNDDIDSLILSALKHIINCGNDCINFQHNHLES